MSARRSHFLEVWEGSLSNGSLISLLRAAASSADAAQIMGLAVTRYILKVPPVVAMDRAQIVRLLGPTMQRYVVGKRWAPISTLA
jgi:hypothetical protein